MGHFRPHGHPNEIELADYLSAALPQAEREQIELHLASCEECLLRMVSGYESVKSFRHKNKMKDRRRRVMNKINVYLILAIISFALSFITPRFFLQFLVATLLLGAKWVIDSKTTKMLIMINEAWKKGGEKEASRLLERFNTRK